MKHPALPSKICTKDHRLGWVGGGRRSEGPILPFHLAPDQPQPQLDICNLCGFHGAFLPSSMLIFVFRSMPFTASHTVKVIPLPFPRHLHPDLDIPHHPLPSSRNSHPGPLPLAWRWASGCKAQATLAACEGDGKGSRHRAGVRDGSGSFLALARTPWIGPCFCSSGAPQVGRRVRSLGVHAHLCVSCRYVQTGRCKETFCSSKSRRQGWGF